MDTQNFFPNFKPNQVLTNTQLNQLRQYLDDQTRLSRVRLTGTGIVCGLFGKPEGLNTVRIISGFGISSDGYIIEAGNATYTKYRNYVDPKTVEPDDDNEEPYPEYEPWRTKFLPYQQIQILELLSNEQLDAPDFVEIKDNQSQVLSPVIFKDKILVLYIEIVDDPLKSCIVTDCNNKGENVVFTVRALLINIEDLDEINPCTEKDALIYFPRLITYLQSTGKTLADIENSAELHSGYREITKLVANEIYSKVKASYNKYKTFLNLEPEFEQDINNLQVTLDNINGIGFNQYRFDFIRQLAKVYNEFADAMCPLIKDCVFDGYFPRHLMLRDFIEDEGELIDSGKHRHNFIPSPARNVIHEDLEKAQKLFARIMILSWNQNFGGADKLKITPGQNLNYNLGERAIPHFYKLNNIEKWWQPDGCCTLHPPLSYSKNLMRANISIGTALNPQENPLHLDQGQFGFYHIEGHLGKQLGSIIEKLNKIRNDFNLEFDIVGLSFDQLSGGAFFEGLESVKEVLDNIEALRKLLEQAINNGVSQNAEQIRTLMEQIAAAEENLLALNSDWVIQRKGVLAGCNISHLQADYLQLRSELICTYDKILNALGKVPNVSPPSGTDTCVNFDTLEDGKFFDGDEFPSGSEIFRENNIPVTMHDFFWTNGGVGYNWAKAQQAGPGFGEGIILWTNNVNIGFDFSQLETLPNKVSFYYKNDGGNENIQVNDGQRIITRIKNGEGEIAPNVNLQVTLINEADQVYMATLTGGVQTLQIGGQEFSIDQVCALYEEQGMPSISMKYVNLKKKSLETTIAGLEKKQKSIKTEAGRKTMDFRIETLNNEKKNLENISYISNSINFINRDILVHSNPLIVKGNTGEPEGARVFSPLAGGNNPMQDLAYSLYLGILDIKTKIKMLLEILPKDVRGFNYLLYSYIAKEIMEQLIRVRMIVNFLLDLLVSLSGTTAPLMRFIAGPIISMFVKNLSQLMDFLNAYQKIQYNCFPAELATIYFHLGHLLNVHVGNFKKFASKHSGMEHLAGVPKGGTFVIVSEKTTEKQLVRADFALFGKSNCCCEIDPSDICLPPMAVIDHHTFEVIQRPETGTYEPIAYNFDVLKNDLNLNNYGTPHNIILRETTSRMGANLTILLDDEGRKLIQYELESPQIGIDEFSYELKDDSDNCNLADIGKVIILIRQKSDAPAYTGEDIAVTHINQSVTIDVAMNDVANPQLLYSGYSLNTPSTTSKGNTVQVISIENSRQALKFYPNEGFQGRDSFIYTIAAGNISAKGLVTVLVIPCCDGNAAAPAGIIQGFVFEKTIQGLQGTLSGGNAELLQGGTLLQNTGINKGQFIFDNVPAATYEIRLSRNNPTTGEPTHETKTLTGISLNSGQSLTLETVELPELKRNAPKLNIPVFIGDFSVASENLGKVAGLEKTAAAKVVADIMTFRITPRIALLDEVKSANLVNDKKLLDKTIELVAGESRAQGKNTLRAFKNTAANLIKNFSAAGGDEQKAYRTLINVMTHTMLDEIALREISGVSADTGKQLTEIAAKLKEAGVSVKNLKGNWKSIELKNNLKINAVTEINKAFS